MAKRNVVVEEKIEDGVNVTDSSENLVVEEEVKESAPDESLFVSVKESESLQAKGKSVVEIVEFNGIIKHRLE